MATILVSAPFDDVSTEESLTDFKLPQSLEKFSQQSKAIYLIHSQDDPIVPFQDVTKYQTALPHAKTMLFKDRQHFNQETFPELLDIIQTL